MPGSQWEKISTSIADVITIIFAENLHAQQGFLYPVFFFFFFFFLGGGGGWGVVQCLTVEWYIPQLASTSLCYKYEIIRSKRPTFSRDIYVTVTLCVCWIYGHIIFI